LSFENILQSADAVHVCGRQYGEERNRKFLSGSEGRPLTKENTKQSHTRPTQSGGSVSQRLSGVRKGAKERKKLHNGCGDSGSQETEHRSMLAHCTAWQLVLRSHTGAQPPAAYMNSRREIPSHV